MRRGAWLVAATLTAVILCWSTYNGQTQGAAKNPAALFKPIASVLQSPRCINCHPRGNRPTQGDDRHTHLMNVQRGADGNGMPAMRCGTCHQAHNNEALGIPGAPGWHLAPASMGWVGLSEGNLCRTLLDRRKNGGRSVADLVNHMTGGDVLVTYAWNPGGQRTPPPLSVDALKAAVDAWAAAGAPCPK